MDQEKFSEILQGELCRIYFVELYTGQALAHEVIDCLARHCFILTGLYNISTCAVTR